MMLARLAALCLAAGAAGPQTPSPRDRLQRLRVVRSGDVWGLPADAVPMDAASGRVLFSSDSTGLWEVAGGKSVRRWASQPRGKPGEARYAPDGIYTGIYGKGLADLRAGGTSFAKGVRAADLLQLLVLRSGDVWIAGVPLPSSRGAGVQIVRGGRAVRDIPLRSRELATLRSWIEVPDRGSVFAATLAGIVELRPDAPVALLSSDPVAAIARQPGGGAIGIVGSVVARWDGSRFQPLLFRPGLEVFGSPIDLAIDASGAWYVLYPRGAIAVLDASGELVRTIGRGDGLPPTARRLLLDPAGSRVLIGSDEGVVAIEE